MRESFLYQPIEVLKPVAEGLWIVDGPAETMRFAGIGVDFPTRMVVIRLRSGELFLWSPIALVPALQEAIDAIGDVRHLISPNRIHYAHIGEWQHAYPRAVAWASPGVRERAASQRIEVAFERDLEDAPDPAWADDLDQLLFRGSSSLEEVVFFHRASRTLLLADLIEDFEPERLSFVKRVIARLGGVLDPDGKAAADVRATYRGRHDIARACLDRVLAWNPERVIIAHGRWYDRNGADELRRAFRWLSP
jgi:hypothetical protein